MAITGRLGSLSVAILLPCSLYLAANGHCVPLEPDFSLAAKPALEVVPRGNPATFLVTITPSRGFSGTAAFEATGLPSGATASFAPPWVSVSAAASMARPAVTNRSWMTVQLGSSSTGSFQLTITATSSNLRRTTAVRLRTSESLRLTTPRPTQ